MDFENERTTSIVSHVDILDYYLMLNSGEQFTWLYFYLGQMKSFLWF